MLGAVVRRVLYCALVAVGLISVQSSGVLAQEVVMCQTANGPRTSAEITAELQKAGYGGPWDRASQLAAYARATGGPATCGSTPTPAGQSTVVVLAAGYGSDLAVAGQQFAPLQAAMLARDARTSFVFFSYLGSNVQGCASTPTAYSATDTAQSLAASTHVMQSLLQTLAAACPDRIAVVGHSLGGLVAFRTVSDQPTPRVSNVVTVDSPLGGVPASDSNLCIDTGFCAAGPLVDDLSYLFSDWSRTTADNQSRDARIRSTGTQLSAWGNTSDCLYYAQLCTQFLALAGSGADARETQWLGITHPVRRDYPFAPHLWNIPASHTAVLENAASDIAAEVLPQ
jgi:pimeloyl-ACP methyl ester carboxylesterase